MYSPINTNIIPFFGFKRIVYGYVSKRKDKSSVALTWAYYAGLEKKDKDYFDRTYLRKDETATPCILGDVIPQDRIKFAYNAICNNKGSYLGQYYGPTDQQKRDSLLALAKIAYPNFYEFNEQSLNELTLQELCDTLYLTIKLNDK